jgi:hypothetical protein
VGWGGVFVGKREMYETKSGMGGRIFSPLNILCKIAARCCWCIVSLP